MNDERRPFIVHRSSFIVLLLLALGPFLRVPLFGDVAVAAPAPLVYGLIRMFEAYAADVDIAEHVTVVDSVEAAHRWLEGLAAD